MLRACHRCIKHYACHSKLFSGRAKALELYLKNTEGEWRRRRAEDGKVRPRLFYLSGKEMRGALGMYEGLRLAIKKAVADPEVIELGTAVVYKRVGSATLHTFRQIT